MTVLIIHVAATLAMAGIIWFVQVVHYPLFVRASRTGFDRFAEEHQRLTTIVVAPLMLVEAGSAAVLLLAPPPGVEPRWLWIGAALLALIWASTVLVQVPLHARLSGGWDHGAQRRLVRSNWVRTIAWTARAVLVSWLVALAFRALPT